MVGVSLFMARGLMVPLGRLIAKTRRIHRFPFEEEDGPAAEIVYDEPGEWYDLERALNELSRDLRAKTIRLSREKTELRAIMSSINEAVLAIGKERRPLFFNSQCAVLFKLDPATATELKVGEVIRAPDVLQAYERCFKDGSASRVETRLELGDGPSRFFQVSVAPLRKKHNQEVYGAVAVFHDVTELKKAEQMRIEFVGNVSHELRTPLTSIKGYLQTVIQDAAQGRHDQATEFLGVVEKNVERLMHLVDDLLDLSALQSGVALKKTKIDLRQLTGNVLNQVDSRSHQVIQEFDSETLFADEHRVEQVLRNLLQNAVRYVPKDGLIKIRWQATGQGGTQLSVKDNGPGIPKEHQGRLFERFYRIDEARTRQVGGSGIGLALVKHIMQRHGGIVTVQSAPGQGSEFICEFPANQGQR
jgi:two-component system phosphate regulon sensor histidine kinase PhoR